MPGDPGRGVAARGAGRRDARGRSPGSCWPRSGSPGRTGVDASRPRSPATRRGPGCRGTGRDWFRGTGIARVIRWWFDSKGGRVWSRSRSTETALRPCPPGPRRTGCWRCSDPTGSPGGDFLAVDHRDSRSPCRLELVGGGPDWLGPEWGDGRERTGRTGVAAPAVAVAHRSAADLIEWSYRGDGVRITRSALLLRGRRLAHVLDPGRARGSSWGVEPTLRLTMPAGRRGRADQGIARAGPGRAGPSRRGARPADRPALPPVSHRPRVVPGRGARAHPAPGARRPAVLAPPARLLGPGAAPQAPELAGADRLGTVAGRRARPRLRRARELGTRRDVRHLSQPRPARPTRLPRPPDRRAVPRRRVRRPDGDLKPILTVE